MAGGKAFRTGADRRSFVFAQATISSWSLIPGDFFPTLTQDSKFRLLANGEPSSKCRWLDQEALGEVTAELTQLELAYWRDISELLAIETSQPQTAVSVHEPGELLIREGEQSTCIFEMIGGEAEVVVGGNIVGQIHSGEFFGVVYFSSKHPAPPQFEQPRTAQFKRSLPMNLNV